MKPPRVNCALVLRLLLLTIGIVLSAHAELTEQRQRELDNLLKHDCGSCHGLHRNGGLGPGLQPQDLEHHNLNSLTGVILYGVPETAMPAWSSLLSVEEARYLATLLKTGNP